MLSPCRVWVPLAVSLALWGCGSPPRAPSAKIAPVPASTDASTELAGLGRSLHVRFGIPVDADASDDFLIHRDAYVASYNPNRGTPNWVAWRLSRDDLGNVGRADDFREDERL